MIPDTYIIRIYRRDKSNPRLIVGIMERIGSGDKKGFTTFEELRELLVPPGAGRSARFKGLKNRRGIARKGM